MWDNEDIDNEANYKVNDYTFSWAEELDFNHASLQVFLIFFFWFVLLDMKMQFSYVRLKQSELAIQQYIIR